MSPSEQDMTPKGMEVGGLGLITDLLRACSDEGLSLNPMAKLFLDTNANIGVSVTDETSNHKREIVVEFIEGQPILKMLLGLKTAKVTSLRINEEKIHVAIDGFPDIDLDVVE
tara:strand:- start:1346 stop:1684 length:339 start_codon:yes stop_codon:yes gene_type:complete